MKIDNKNDIYKYTPDEIYDYICELHNKIDKAIEYLEDDDNFWIPDSYSEDKVKMIQEELLKILKDSDLDDY